MPGVSRSGATITAGLALGLTREAAARFSFPLGTPIILGAGLFKLRDLNRGGQAPGEAGLFVAGMLAAAIAGWLVIGILLRWLRTRTLWPFVVYRFAIGGGVLLYALLRSR